VPNFGADVPVERPVVRRAYVLESSPATPPATPPQPADEKPGSDE